MLICRSVTGRILLAGMVLGAGGTVSGQPYPYKPLRIFTSAPGANNDFNARIVAQGLTASLGQPVVVDNRGAVPSAELASKAPADGYTLLVAATSFIIGPLLQPMSYDALRDFAPITVTASSPNLVVVHPSVPVNTISELLALARAKPGGLNYASGGTGTSAHLAAELFKSMARVDIVRVAYKGDGPAINAMISGEVQLIFATAGSVMPHVKSGKLKAIAVTTPGPTALIPGMPSVAESGVPGYESVQASGVFAPLKTPAAIVTRLNQEIVRILNKPDVKEKFLNIGAEVVGNTPQEFTARIKAEVARMGKVIKDAGIKAD